MQGLLSKTLLKNGTLSSFYSITLGYTYLPSFAIILCNESYLQRQIKRAKFRLPLDLHIQCWVREEGIGKALTNSAHHLWANQT